MTTDSADTAGEVLHLRRRVFEMERLLRIAYPEDREGLQADLEALQEQLRDLEPEVESEMASARERLEQAVADYFAARETIARLSGHVGDPGFASGVFAHVAQSTDAGFPLPEGMEPIRQDANAVREALLEEIAPRQPARVPEHQLVHEQRLANERAGRGYFTDEELSRKEQNEFAFLHGHEARRGRKLNA